uniref:Acidic nuclear phosphoprotein 32 family member A n=1 Tax=Myotis myotis TaxID=51298 RepID=A0A7J8AIQ0_MYOMY|nr:acidic nuclear phosphoprotein 32 family member A [Myotis myotis]
MRKMKKRLLVKKKRVRSENENLKMKEKKMTKWIPILKNSYCDLTVFTHTPQILTPETYFFLIVTLLWEREGKSVLGVVGRGWAGGGGIKYYFYCHSLFFPLLFLCLFLSLYTK